MFRTNVRAGGCVEKRTAVKNVTVEFLGPMSEIEAWAKKLATKKVLARID